MFFAMALYDGETLKKRVERGPTPIAEAVDFARQIADGLARAHESGIAHRDIKPANVMVTSDGLIKVLDFGLAKLQDQTGLTRTGTTLGTVAYMAPEQISGETADARSDVWALGVLLYELVTGQRPFRGDRDAAVLNAILVDPPQPLETLRPDAPPELRRIVARALSKNPAARYPSAREMLRDLTTCAHAIDDLRAARRPSSTIGAAFRRPVIAISVAVVLLVAAVLAGTAIARSRRIVWAHTVAIPEIQRLASEDQHERAFTLLQQAEQYIPNDPVLAGLAGQVSVNIAAFTTSPSGATLSARPFGALESEWRVIDRLAYVGLSFGGSTALPVAVLEPRIKVAVLLSGGFTDRDLPPEVDEVNYVTRFTKPVLMVNGAYDNIFPVEAAQKPLFDRFATPPQDKRHVVLPEDHIVWGASRGQVISEVLAWLDRYLGRAK